MTLRIECFPWHRLPPAARHLRERVFIEEQGVPAELEWDSTDEIAEHFVGFNDRDDVVAVGRLYPSVVETGRIGRMAVAPQQRGQGTGRALLREIMRAGAQRYNVLCLSAQEQAVPFYERCGFHLCSDTYEEAGLPHRDMRCVAPGLIVRADSPAQDAEFPMLLGRDDGSWLYSDVRDWTQLAHTLAGQASQRLWIYDRLLEHDRYDAEFFCDELSRLARRHRATEIRILIQDDRPLVERRHRVVQLMQRLPSSISLKLINPNYPFDEHAFILADNDGLLFRHDWSAPAGFANFSASGRVRLLAEQYQRQWDYGKASVELRQLPL